MMIDNANGVEIEVTEGIPWFGIDKIRICRTIETYPSMVGVYNGRAFDMDRLTNYMHAKYSRYPDSDQYDKEAFELFVLREYVRGEMQETLDILIGM